MNDADQNVRASAGDLAQKTGVAFAIADGDGRWLVIRRSEHVIAPGKVCFPGGGIEPGETEAEALVREAMEELNVRVRPVRRFWQTHVPARALLLYGWLAELDPPGQRIMPDPAEVAEVMWLRADDIRNRDDGLDNNAAFLDALEASL